MQLKLWDHSVEQAQKKVAEVQEPVRLFVDGASRGNPGDAGAGVVIIQGESRLYKGGFYLGRGTNNEAEYWALLIGLQLVFNLGLTEYPLFIFSDSQLMVRQIRGEYRVKNEHLRPLFARAKERLEHLSFTITHVLREYNKEADAMANRGIDTHTLLPGEIVEQLGMQL